MHMITETDHATGQTIQREATADEAAQFEADQKTFIEVQAKKAERAAARAALLERLGLTADEAALLLS